jgi:hypothetical protein
MNAAKRDWQDAAASSTKALEVIDAALTSALAETQQQVYNSNKIAALNTRALGLRRVAAKFDGTQVSAAWKAHQEYIAVEPDPAKKAKARGEGLQMLFDAGATDRAIEESRIVLAAEPNDLTASRVPGFALFTAGDRENFQEAADRLQWYVDTLPGTDPLKVLAKETLDYLLGAENIKPRVRQATAKPPPRP